METKICQTCGDPRPLTAFRAFKAKANGATVTKRGHTCRKCVRQQRAAIGRCWFCNRMVIEGKKYCQRHLDTIAKSASKRRGTDRQAVLDHYGRKCAYCGDDRELFLTIDHVNNDGAEHRRQMYGNSRTGSGSPVYQWLRTKGYPPEFQVLCFNCNSAKAIHGEASLLEYLNGIGKRTTNSGC